MLLLPSCSCLDSQVRRNGEPYVPGPVANYGSNKQAHITGQSQVAPLKVDVLARDTFYHSQ